MNPLQWNWLAQSLVALGFIVPAWLSLGFFERAYGINGGVTAIWYFLGTAVGCAIGLHVWEPTISLVPASRPLALIFLTGLILGAGTNLFLYSAVVRAPVVGVNAAVPIAIISTSTVFVFLLSALLASYFPALLRPATIDPYRLVGVVGALAFSALATFGRDMFNVLSQR